MTRTESLRTPADERRIMNDMAGAWVPGSLFVRLMKSGEVHRLRNLSRRVREYGERIKEDMDDLHD